MRTISTTTTGELHHASILVPGSSLTVTICSRSGPGNPFSATTGIPWVKAVTDLFAAGPGAAPNGGNLVPPPLVMGFSVRS